MIKKIEIDGLLSFDKFELELQNLNVLIGPNGSGKSNLIEVLALLEALPKDISQPIRSGGGIGSWLKQGRDADASALIGVQIEHYKCSLHYVVSIQDSDGRPTFHERVDGCSHKSSEDRFVRIYESDTLTQHSVLAGFRHEMDVITSVELLALSRTLMGIVVYRPGAMGVQAAPRRPQPADHMPDLLTEDAENLALIVSRTINSGEDEPINTEFRRFFPQFARFTVSVFGNQVLLYMHEDGVKQPIPATRWSDGMIRYLCLLVILLDPEPPPLICIDEPELGFHPDILPHLARLIKQASERTQIIITTHSKDLVDGFSDDPSVVVVCERDHDGATRMRRLDGERLKKWLDDYTLGELWESGEIGGNPQ